MNKVEQKFLDKAVYPSTILILRKDDAIELINHLEKSQIAILGVDGFIPREDMLVQPSLEHSINFTGECYSKLEDTWEEARKFIIEKTTPLYFELVCNEETN